MAAVGPTPAYPLGGGSACNTGRELHCSSQFPLAREEITVSVSSRRCRAAAPVICLLLFGFGSTAAQAADWTWQNPLPQGNPLSGVWGSSGSNVFAVGDLGTILHSNGSSWSAMSSGAGNNLSGVWGSSGSNVFAVGDWGTILHYGNELFASGFESGGLDGWSAAEP